MQALTDSHAQLSLSCHGTYSRRTTHLVILHLSCRAASPVLVIRSASLTLVIIYVSDISTDSALVRPRPYYRMEYRDSHVYLYIGRLEDSNRPPVLTITWFPGISPSSLRDS